LINLKSHRGVKESISLDDVKELGHKHREDEYVDDEVIIKGHTSKKTEPVTEPKSFRPEPKSDIFATKRQEIEAPRVIGKIDLDNQGNVRKKEEPKPQAPKPPVEPQPIAETTKKQEEPKKIHEPVQEATAKVVPELKKEKIESQPKPVIEEPLSIETNNEDRFEADVLTTNVPKMEEVKVVGRIDLDLLNQKTRPAKKSKKQKEEDRKDRERVRREELRKTDEGTDEPEVERDQERTGPVVIKAKVEKLAGPTIVGKIEVPGDKRPGQGQTQGDAAQQSANRKKKRKRISKELGGNQQRVNVGEKPAAPAGERKKLVVTKNIGGVKPSGDRNALKKRTPIKKEVSEEDVQKQIKDTLARLTTKGTKSKGSKYRKDKRQMVSDKLAAQAERDEANQSILKVTEFVSVNELATMMDTSVTNVISTCMSLGLFVSINQRLDAETMAIVADEFGFKVEFVSAEIQVAIEEEPDTEDQLLPRAPIVTVMGHVDHGKTSLLDHIRNTNVIAGEAGGITQHIGAYHGKLKNGKDITFLETPGKEALTHHTSPGPLVTKILTRCVPVELREPILPLSLLLPTITSCLKPSRQSIMLLLPAYPLFLQSIKSINQALIRRK